MGTNVFKTYKNEVCLKKIGLEHLKKASKESADYTVCILDTETTGFHLESNNIIELAILKLLVNKDGTLEGYVDHYHSYQDPGEEIPDYITAITGITQEMVKGKNIDLNKVKEYLNDADYIVAHNAKFDRQFMKKMELTNKEQKWLCSYQMIDWLKLGYPSAKLELLAHAHGFFVDAHSALNDVVALAYLLFRRFDGGLPYFSTLLEAANKEYKKIVFFNLPYDMKDIVKNRGYKWDSNKKCWYTITYDIDSEREWVKENQLHKIASVKAYDISLEQLFL